MDAIKTDREKARCVAYSYADSCKTQRHNKDERHSSLEKYTSHFIERVVCERELETKQNCNILTPSVTFPFSWAAQPATWGPSLSGTCSSIQHLFFNWSDLQTLNFLCTELYNNSTSTFFLWASQIALIQPVHGQGYILIFLDRMHLLFTPVHFLF